MLDSAVNPSRGTINTSLLHNLLHVIINQLPLSGSAIELHGVGSAAIEDVNTNSQQQCRVKIREFNLVEDVDEATGSHIKKRVEVQRLKRSDELVAISHDELDAESPTDSIQVLSIERSRKHQTNSIHNDVIPSDAKLTKAESSFQSMLDSINTSKRLDAVEIGIRQLAEILKKIQCDKEKFNVIESVIEPELATLSKKIDELADEIKRFKCKCNCDGYEELLFKDFRTRISKEFEDRLTMWQREMEDLKGFSRSAVGSLQDEMKSFEAAVCNRLESYKDDLDGCMSELQEMLNGKLDKFHVPDLKNYLQNMIDGLDTKIENIECKQALAAGVAKKIFKDLNCVSCGVNVIQADTPNPAQSKLTQDKDQRAGVVGELRLLKLPTRICGGSHTITTPRERIFRSENCQN